MRRPQYQVLLLAGTHFALLVAVADNPWLGLVGGLALGISRLEVPDLLLLLARDTHPPLYYLGLHYWTELAGTGAYITKYLGMAAGVVGVALAFQLGRRLGGTPVGLITAYLVAISFSHIVQAVSLRDFALGVTLSLGSVYLFLAALEASCRPVAPGPRRRNWRVWVAYGLCSAAALYTYYFAAPVFVAQGLYLLLTARYRGTLVAWLGAMGVVGAAYLPWGWVAGAMLWEKLAATGSWGIASRRPFPLDPDSGFFLMALRWLTSSASTAVAPWLVGLLVSGLVALAWTRRRRVQSIHAALVALGLALGLLFAYGAARLWNDDENVERYVYSALPFFAPFLAIVIHRIGRGRPVALAGLLCLLTVPSLRSVQLFLRPSEGRPPGMSLQEYFERNASRDDLLLFTDLEQAGYFAATARDRWSWRSIPTSSFWFRFTPIPDPGGRMARLLQEPPPVRALWLILWEDSPANTPVVSELERRAYPAASEWVDSTYVAAYLPPLPLEPCSQGALFEEGVTLAALAHDRQVVPGNALRVSLQWRPRRRIESDYSAFVHFVDADGRTWAQHDGVPHAGLRPTTSWQDGEMIEDRHGLLLPSELPPGAYWLDVGLSGGGRRLRLETGGNAVRLGPVQVAGP